MDLKTRALNLLARREHSQYELRRKLLEKGYASDKIDSLLVILAKEGLQSDARYTEAYVRQRATAGFGPRRIRMELQQRGVSDSLLDYYLHQKEAFWWQVLLSVWQKKYDAQQILDAKKYAKQQRFLLQRGFEPDHIHQLLSGKNEY